MKIITNGVAYRCSGYSPGAGTVGYTLPDGAPGALGPAVVLSSDDGTELATQAVADYLRWFVSDKSLVLTNTPEPGPTPPPPPPEPSTETAALEMLSDVDYRLSLLELGASGGV